jgi:pilus assembly protein CpaD
MRRVTSLTAIMFVSLSLGACASGPRGALTATNNPSVYSVHQPVVQHTNFVLDLDASGDALSAAERARLVGWFDAIELRYGDQIFVEEPSNYPSGGARAGVAQVLSEYGMLLRPGSPVTAGSVPPGTVRVVASRATASVPECPNWSDPEIAPTVNTSANFGCALNSNLAAMIADPNDLIRGRQGSVNGSASVANRAVRVYRDRVPTGTQPLASPSTRSGGN